MNLIQEKSDGRIKGRTYVNGSKKRFYLKDGESVASPTLSIEGLVITLLIAAYEGRKVISLDVPGAFLQADLPDEKMLLLVLSGDFLDYM